MDESGNGEEFDRRRLAGNRDLDINLTGFDDSKLRQMCILAGVCACVCVCMCVGALLQRFWESPSIHDC